MALDENEEEQSRLLRHALSLAGISVGDLWLRSFSIGGNIGEYEIQAYLGQLLSLPALERNILAHAANELIDEQPSLPHAPYTDDLTTGHTAGRNNPPDAGNTRTDPDQDDVGRN